MIFFTLEISIKLWAFLKEDDLHRLCVSQLWTAQDGVNKCLKMLVSEDLSTSNMLNGLKQCLSLHSSCFNIFIDQNEWNLVGKSLS